MLVCNVSQLARRAAIAVDVAEAAAALDAPGTGNVVFATLVDDPASVRESVDAFLGQIMREAASAASTVNAGFTYAAAIGEVATAIDTLSGAVPLAATVAETAAAAAAQDAAIAAAPVVKTIDGTAGGQFSTASTGTVTLSTTSTNDVVVLVYFHEGTTPRTVSTVTSPHLTWTKRSNYGPSPGGQPYDLEIWWAPAAAVLTSEVITITLTGAIDDAAYHVFGVKGCSNISAPWDVHSSLATARAAGLGAANLTATVSTNSTNPMVIGFTGTSNNTTITNPAGTTKIRADQNNGGGSQFAYLTSFYQYNTSALSSVSYTTAPSGGGTQTWAMVVDALA